MRTAVFLEEQEEWAADLLPELSAQEAKAVLLYAHGFSLETIAAAGKISPHTVYSYLARAKMKFEVITLSELRNICLIRAISSLKNKK